MNVENIMKTRQHIAALPDKQIDMGTLGPFKKMGLEPKCGSAGCIAGWAVAVCMPKEELRQLEGDYYCVEGLATDLLGLDEKQTKRLFCGDLCPVHLSKLTKEDVLGAIDSLLETDDPVWPDFIEAEFEHLSEIGVIEE